MASAQDIAKAAAIPVVDATLVAADSFTDPITLTDTDFAVSITGTFVGTVTVQVAPVWRDIPQPDWVDVGAYTAPTAKLSRPLRETWRVRAGFKAGEWTSGSAVIAINCGEPENRRTLVLRSGG